MKIRCINCGYFLNCNKADENITECADGVKANRIIVKRNDKECLEVETENKKTMTTGQTIVKRLLDLTL